MMIFKMTKYWRKTKKRGFTIDSQNALKKHTQFCLVGIFEASLKLKFVLKIKTVTAWHYLVTPQRMGAVCEAFFSSVFPEASFLFWRFNFKLPFALWWRLCHFSNIRLFERIVWVFIITVLLSLRLWMLFRHLQAWRYYDIYSIPYINLLIR